ncbi:MAG: hypothetical protein HDR12_12510 [Lachnospiraceae bacterium]|nr:hypothetical protein [Lachnospiraceae bacterium]
METIGMLIKIIILLLFIAAGLGFMIFPILFETDIKNKTGKGFLNRWMTGIEFICLIGCFEPSSDSFYGNLGCMFLSMAVSAMIAWKKAKKLHLENIMALGAVFAQILSPVSLLFIVIIIGRFFSKLKKGGKS